MPDYADPNLEDTPDNRAGLRELIDAIGRGNARLETELNARGVGFTAADVVRYRLNLLIEHLLGDMDAMPRLQFERAWFESMRESLSAARSGGALIVPSTVDPGR